MSEATLGFKIDSSQAVSGAADLDRLTAAANRTQQAADKLEAEASTLGGALSRAGQGAGSAAQPLERVGRALADQDEHVRAFRMEVERLTLKYQPLAQATKSYEAAVNEIERAHKVGIITTQQMTQALDRERMAYEKLRTSAASAGAAVKAANTNSRGMGNERAAGINAGYQFQDIAVTAAMGMNPLMIGLQQGTQLASVVGSMERPVAGLAAAFASLISPVSLVTIGLTAGVAALVQYFTTADEGTGKTSKLFEEQNDIIRQAAALWGDAAPALKAYVDELDRADKITQGREAAGILAGRELEGLSSNLDAVKRQATEAFRALQGDPNNAVIVRDLRTAWGDLRDKLDDGSATMADLTRVQQQLGTAVQQYGVTAVLDFSKAFAELAPNIESAIEKAERFRGVWIDGPKNIQDILSGATFSDGGKTFRSADFMPANIPVPGRRPLDLDQAPDTSWPQVTNGDGRLTNVPVPGQRPNFFEIEEQTEKVDDLEKAYRRAQDAKADFWLDIGFQERQRERSAMDQQVASTLQRYGQNEDLNSPEASAIRGQLQWQQAKDLAKGFGDAFSSELISGSHDIGKAFLKGFEAAISNEASKLWEKVFDSLGNIFANLVSGGKGGSGAGAGVASSLVSAAAGGAANDNIGRAPVMPVTRSALGDISSYAKAIQSIESGGNYGALGPLTKSGDRAYGAYQVMGANIPSWTKGALGSSLSPSEFLGNKDAQDAVFSKYFGDSVSKFGNPQDAASVWFTGRPLAQGAGSADILGTTGSQYVDKFNSALGDATKNVGTFGGGLGQLGQSLSGAFPAAPQAGGGGGGLFSWLGGLFGGFKPMGAQAGLAAAGGIGLYADGTNYAPGGMAIVGERGPELVNLPQGSQVFNTNKSKQMMGGSRESGGNQRPIQNFYLDGARGDDHIREIARQGAAEGIARFKESEINGGFGETQKQYTSRVA